MIGGGECVERVGERDGRRPWAPARSAFQNPPDSSGPNNPARLNNLIEQVRQIAYDLHVYLGNGLLEKVYENGLKHRLEKVGLKVETQKEMKVFDEDGFEIGNYYADVVVEDELIVELKAVRAIAPEHLAQTMNYLKITGKEIGLIINFGAYKFESRKVFAPRK